MNDWREHQSEDIIVKDKEGATVAVVGQLITDGIYQLLDLLESEGYSIQIGVGNDN